MIPPVTRSFPVLSGIKSWWSLDRSPINDNVNSINLGATRINTSGKIENCVFFPITGNTTVEHGGSFESKLRYNSGDGISYTYWFKLLNPFSISGILTPGPFFSCRIITGSSQIVLFDSSIDTSGLSVTNTNLKTNLAVSIDGVFQPNVQLLSGFNPAIEQWYFVAVMYDATTQKISTSINASGIITSSAFQAIPSGTFGAFRFGKSNQASGNSFLVDNITLWHKTLSQTEINALYNSGDGANLVTFRASLV